MRVGEVPKTCDRAATGVMMILFGGCPMATCVSSTWCHSLLLVRGRRGRGASLRVCAREAIASDAADNLHIGPGGDLGYHLQQR